MPFHGHSIVLSLLLALVCVMGLLLASVHSQPARERRAGIENVAATVLKKHLSDANIQSCIDSAAGSVPNGKQLTERRSFRNLKDCIRQNTDNDATFNCYDDVEHPHTDLTTLVKKAIQCVNSSLIGQLTKN